jgi:hypothetical protein
MGIHYSLLLLKRVLVEPFGSRNICNQTSTFLTYPLSLVGWVHSTKSREEIFWWFRIWPLGGSGW